ncbi:hypothetical protein GRX01_02770 [Halobaculum sp. WSA2]|uniref:Uncharacterized protein n=1 Tax=Halobaculum saliterrae TaxID=2073113 RepID=A0A6B0SVM8_9EURY|nr:DUF5788 family protein [Halobaculum saliterrae]MXR40282.1 hypothetical protein [Halobaculum saliterrae]
MNEHERDRLLGKLRRASGTLGERVPEQIEIEGESVDLRSFVFECDQLETVPESQRERIEGTLSSLRRARIRRKRRIEDGEIPVEEGERLVTEIRGIERAIRALEALDEPELGEQVRRDDVRRATELRDLARRLG